MAANKQNAATNALIELNVGDLAPDVALENAEGQAVQLAAFWHARPVVLVFTRHFG